MTVSAGVAVLAFASGEGPEAFVARADQRLYDDRKGQQFWMERDFGERQLRCAPRAQHRLFDHLDVFYNQQRRHSAIGYASPAELERAARLRCRRNRLSLELAHAQKDDGMDLKRLQYFCTIVEQGQISRAARTLHMSQPPLSQRLKELEDELGVALILRDDQPWQVTESGKVLYQRASQIMAQLAELPAEVTSAADGAAGHIVFGTSTTCLSHVLPALPDLHASFPRLQFRVHVTDSAILEEQVKQREIDFAVLLLPLREDVFTVHHLPADHFAVVFSPNVKAEHGSGPCRVEHLAGVPLLLLRRDRGGGSYEQLIKSFQRERIRPKILLDSSDVHVLLEALECGLQAAAIVPASQVPDRFRERYRTCALDVPEMAIHPALVHLPDRYLTSAARAFIARIERRSENEH